MANGVHGQWGLCGMGPMGHGGPMGDLDIFALCGLRWFKLNVSKCQKDVKCQIVKHLDYGGGS